MKKYDYNKENVKFYNFFPSNFIIFPFLIFSIVFLTSVGSQSLLDKQLTIQMKNSTLKEVINQISKTTNIDFVYKSGLLSDNTKIEVDYKNERIFNILDVILSSRDIYFEEQLNKIVLTKKDSQNIIGSTVPINTQLINIRGTVIDKSDGVPLMGASVVVKNESKGAVTDFDGKYSIEVDSKEDVLVFSFVGYLTKEVKVGNQTEINVSLESDVSELDEVILIGYGTAKKSDVIGSISSIKGKELGFKSSASFESSLQGLASGVSVQTQGGNPGAPTVIKIRGTNSINSTTDPLWVIDGMIMDRNPNGLGSSNQSPMSLINQNDIESIEVLKDAAATAIYGSRASNGVILVTTKSGEKGKGYTSFNVSGGFSEITRTPEQVGYANNSDWLAIQDIAYNNSQGRDFRTNDHFIRSPNATVRLTRDQANQINTNWTDEVFRMGYYQDYNLASAGGFEKGSFYVSGNYRDEKGVQTHNDFKRMTLSTNLKFSPGKNFDFGLKTNLAYTDNERRESGTTSIITFALPWFPVKSPDNPNLFYNPYTGTNPAAMNDPDNTLNNVKQYRALVGLNGQYNFSSVKGLSIRSELSHDFFQSNVVNWTSRDIQLNSKNDPTSSAREEAITYNSTIFNIYTTYNKTIDKHGFDVLAGFETQRRSQYGRISEGQDLTTSYKELGNPNIMIDMYGGLGNELYLMSYFGRANYRYNDKYFAGFSARRDGSSAFTEENRWGTFLAFSAGWKISEEPFMDFLGDGTNIKLRGSYGEIGNQDIPPSLSERLYNGNISYGGQAILGVNGTLPTNIANKDLTWETTKSADIGIDFGFLRNRINGSVAYYHKYVEDMLLYVPAAWSAGVASDDNDFGNAANNFTSNKIMINVGDMVNQGFEFDINTININNNDFTWKTNFNISFNKNLIERLTPDIDASGRGLAHEGMPIRSRTGYQRGVWFISDFAGVDPDNGVPMIYTVDKEYFEETGETRRLTDENGNAILSLATTSNIEDNPFYQNGKAIDPTYYGGLKNTFAYKGFDFNFMFTFSGGNYIMDFDRQISTVPNVTRNILSEVLTNSWQSPGDIAKYPQIRAQGEYIVDGVPVRGFDNANVFHNRELYKGDYIRLRDVQLGYNFTEKFSKSIKLNSLRLYLQGTNLYTWTDYPGFDPEGATFLFYSNQIPQTRTFIFGLNAQF